MRILKYSFLLALVLSIVSCEKDRTFTEFEDLEQGAYGRLLDGPNGILDFEDPANSGLDFKVEFYDNNNGQNVENYDWTVSFPGFDAAPIATRSKSDFTVNDNGLPETSISFSFQDVLDALGMTLDDIVLGEQYTFNGTLKTSSGQTFTANNTGGNVISSAPFSGFFSFRQGIENLPCIHALSGTFDCVSKATNQEAGIGWDDCTSEWTGTVIWEAVHDENEFGAGLYNIFSINTDGDGATNHDPSMGIYYSCYSPTTGLPNGADGTAGDVQLNFDCNKAFWTGTSQWGEVFSITDMEANGAELKFKWTNDYGEGAEVTLTRTDGNNWPDDMRS